MGESEGREGSVENFPAARSKLISEELGKIFKILRDAAPSDATVSFDFDGTLHAHIDVRRAEEVSQLKAILPTLGAGLFHDISVGATPHHPFFHRLTAKIDR